MLPPLRPAIIAHVVHQHSAEVTIVEPSADWAAQFRALAAELRDALGPLALRIDHIGSTSVQGLAAKDIIDVQVTVANLSFERLEPRLSFIGLLTPQPRQRSEDHVPPWQIEVSNPADWRKLFFFRSTSDGMRRANVHIRVLGKPNQRYALLFRDYLRTHPATTAAYATLKRKLAALGLGIDTYADVKDPACDIIIAAAEDWAEQTNWHPGPSDG
jgi:GrpB-like predicted nucleotidyltransferase (UPF0157 family)